MTDTKSDLDRIFEEQRQKLSTFGIFSGRLKTADRSDASSISSSHQSKPSSTRSVSGYINNSLTLSARPHDPPGIATDTSIHPKSADPTVADILQKIRSRSSKTRKAPSSAEFKKTGADKRESKPLSARKTKSKTEISVKKEVHEMLERIRCAGDERRRETETEESNLNYIDVTAQTIGKDAAVSVMKVKLTAMTAELEHATHEAAKHLQVAQRKAAELEKLETEHRGLKDRQAAQELKFRSQLKQHDEFKQTNEGLTKDVERLHRELDVRKKLLDEYEKKAKACPDAAAKLSRQTAANEKLRKELEALKEKCCAQQEAHSRQHNQLRSVRDSHRANLKRLMLIVQKQNALLAIKTKQCDLIIMSRFLAISEGDFRKYLHLQPIANETADFASQ
ncbi:hypothetical protein BV898_12704 [Hypsibius exemplaris]|uniref:Uncharacterized protein n=1 Tax=Hypsibius exemplaris TaxID=2072580 RepID=A0A1W0WD09_HYPEX|nr:hypothetical protein BV898_12704 [Hypsibius exemplaris]